MLRPEDLRVFQRGLFGLLILVVQQRLRHPPGQTRRERDDALVVLPQQLHIDARPVIEAVEIPARDHIAEVAVARLVLAEQHEVIRLAVERVLLVEARARRDIDLAADDRLHARGLRRAVEVDHAVHVAVVGDGDGLLPDLLHARHDVADAARAVEQAVFRMHMQMHEAHSVLLTVSSKVPSIFAFGD